MRNATGMSLREYLSCLALAGCFFLGPSLTASTSDSFKDWNYHGYIAGQYAISLTLTEEDGKIKASYFYDRYLEDIALDCTPGPDRSIQFTETDANGKPLALFIGRYADHDPRQSYGPANPKLDRDVIVGTWTKLPDGKPLPFYLRLDSITAHLKNKGRYSSMGVDDAVSFETSVRAFWSAIRENQKPRVVACIHYPITVKIAGSSSEVPDEKHMLAVYEAVFNDRYREAVARTVPRNLFHNYRGAMIGPGLAWFDADGKIIAINQP